MKILKIISFTAIGLFLILVVAGKFLGWGWLNTKHLTGDFDPSVKFAVFNNQRLDLAQLSLKGEEELLPVLGQTSAHKRIEIDLANQRLYAYEDDRRVYNFLVSTGKWGRTPTGRFRIWIKLRYCLMHGGSKILHTYYYLPNVPYTMYFYNWQHPKWQGYGIHGTYWHHNFGHPMSHGCINMKTEEAALLYYWAQPDLRGRRSIYATNDNPGTEIIIYGQAPRQ